jgi:uncharacterized membrane protein YhaH (DUF805 family)
MTFVDSIKTCFTKYVDFNGRASRSEFWWFVLFQVLVSVALSMVSQTVSGLFSLAVLLPGLGVAARRLHDTDKSGWFLLLSFIPIIGWIILIVFYIQEPKEPNRFGAAAPTAAPPAAPAA